MSDVMQSLIAHLRGGWHQTLDDGPEGVEEVIVTHGAHYFRFLIVGTYFEIRGWSDNLQRETTYRYLWGDLGDPAFGEKLERTRLSELPDEAELIPTD